MHDIDALVENTFSDHPFLNIPNKTDYKKLLANYLAMSQAFPYLQAGAQKEIIFHCMNENNDITEEIELTTVVGNFLCWDETGGLALTLKRGLKGLPQLLDTWRFHANLLKKDCALLFGEFIQPEYSTTTKQYLHDLYQGLSSLCAITRVAFMVSFENHANRMINALWKSIANHFNVEKSRLIYFLTHVGGDDPAEAYHVEMTRHLIDRIVQKDQFNMFIEIFNTAYTLHCNWCKSIINIGT